MRQIKKIIVHCSDSEFGDAATIRRWHTDPPPKGRGWMDIGYHFVILNGVREHGQAYNVAEDGLIETGRPIEQPGAHCKGHNRDSIGICLIGKMAFTENQLKFSMSPLLTRLINEYGLAATDVYGHYHFDKGKTCPNMTNEQIRSFIGG